MPNNVKFIKNFLKLLLLLLVILCEVLFIFMVDYTIYDNNHVTIARQTVQISGLPPEFDGLLAPGA